ncbi:MAG: L,D-transpeptidase [Weeksellaceae bacterium]
MKNRLSSIIKLFVVIGVFALVALVVRKEFFPETMQTQEKPKYWFVLHRASEKEELFLGTPGDESRSIRLKTFKIKPGVPGNKPTPLPELIGREYWLLIAKHEAFDNPETAPYFLELDVPISENEPYGPEPYLECDGQCNWQLPGLFGLHGIASDESKLSSTNTGSSGCVRHTDADITYLYNLLDTSQEIRYYVRTD